MTCAAAARHDVARAAHSRNDQRETRGVSGVPGLPRAGGTLAVPPRGPALIEGRGRRLRGYAPNGVRAVDAGAAGQGAAQRFYEWEERYQVRVSVARFPDGKDPGELSVSDPEGLRHAVDQALPFLGFRVNRVLNSRKLRSPEDRALVAGEAMAVVNEHQNPEVRKLYAGQVATHVGIPPADLVALAARRGKAPTVHIAPVPRTGPAENASVESLEKMLKR